MSIRAFQQRLQQEVVHGRFQRGVPVERRRRFTHDCGQLIVIWRNRLADEISYYRVGIYAGLHLHQLMAVANDAPFLNAQIQAAQERPVRT